jgi:hypothetical protein
MGIAALTDAKTASTSLNNSTSANSSSASAQAAASTNPVGRTMGQAVARIQTQLDTTSAQLSSFGKLKSSVSEAQLAAKALGKLSNSSTGAEVQTALSRFVIGLNTAIATAKTTAALPGSAPTEASSAGRLSRDLSRSAISNMATVDALKRLGFKAQADGSFALDASKLEAAYKTDPAAVRSALVKLGEAVETVATKGLATNASVSGSMASLSQRASALKAQQTSMLAVVQKLNTANSTGGNTGYVNYGVSAYRS